jgi:predicted alpha/beta-fold hydrolase
MNSSATPENTNDNRYIKLELSKNGGHVGFFHPSMSGESYWLENRITEFLISNPETT